MTSPLPVSIRMPPEVKLALEQAAKADRRSISSLVVIILTDWLREKGYLAKQGQQEG